MREVQIRTIRPEDDRSLGLIIRSVLEEFGAAKPGTVYHDPEIDHLSELFDSTPGGTCRPLDRDPRVSFADLHTDRALRCRPRHRRRRAAQLHGQEPRLGRGQTARRARSRTRG